MRITTLLIAAAFTATVAGCTQPMSADGQRAVIGGVGAAVASKAFGGSRNDALLAAGAGAAAGALCDDAGICQ